MPGPSEDTPLLDSAASRSSEQSSHEEPPESPAKTRTFLKRRFWWFCLLGIAAFTTLQLVFWPRTSLSRDYRRWHNLHLTQSDVRRYFLGELKLGRTDDSETLEGRLKTLFWELQARSLNVTNLGASESPELARFVKLQMLQFGKTETISLKGGRSPTRSYIEVKDTEGLQLHFSDLKERGRSTPAYFPRSEAGTRTGEYINVNEGSPEDYKLLKKHGYRVTGKIFIMARESTYTIESRLNEALTQGAIAVLVYGLPISREINPSLVSPIVALPISFKDAKPLLEALGESSFWEYGVETPTLRLTVSVGFSEIEMENYVTTIPGVTYESGLLIGASRDSLDAFPGSGHAIMLEIMRTFQKLREMGWRPLRTIRFVSWDGSRSGALGSEELVKTSSYSKYGPLMAYINLDNDVVTGSHFVLESNPLFNHVIERTARDVPFPKNDFYKRLAVDDDVTSLLRYWRLQDGAHIENKLGLLAGSDAWAFECFYDTPTVNVKFGPSPRFNETRGEHSYERLKTIDPDFDLHGLLVRFVGLLAISMGEHEVHEKRIGTYFAKARGFYNDFEPALDLKDVPLLLSDFSEYMISSDLSEFAVEGRIKGHHIFDAFSRLFAEAEKKGREFDDYTAETQVLLKTDYPWYFMAKKIQAYARLQISNYRLARFQRDMALTELDMEFLYGGAGHSMHFMYEYPAGMKTSAERAGQAAFGALYNADAIADAHAVFRHLAVRYDKLDAMVKRIK